LNGGSAEPRFDTKQTARPKKSKPNSLIARNHSLDSGVAAEQGGEAVGDWVKALTQVTKNGQLTRDLGRRIDAIQAIAILIMTANKADVDRLLASAGKAVDPKTKSQRPSPVPDAASDEIVFESLHLDLARHKVTVAGNDVSLTLKEFTLLTLLAERQGRVQSREKLLKDVWKYNCDLDTRTVDTHIRRLRSKLGPARRYIETVNGIGYRFLES
jgi:hypothetical protein